MADHKKAANLIVALMGKPKKPDMEADSEADEPTAVVAAQAVLDAIKGDDATALADAMKSMVASCGGGEY